jgi:hypothetical protein
MDEDVAHRGDGGSSPGEHAVGRRRTGGMQRSADPWGRRGLDLVSGTGSRKEERKKTRRDT